MDLFIGIVFFAGIGAIILILIVLFIVFTENKIKKTINCKKEKKMKIIKLYSSKKLYDTDKKEYILKDEIVKLIQSDTPFRIIHGQGENKDLSCKKEILDSILIDAYNKYLINVGINDIKELIKNNKLVKK